MINETILYLPHTDCSNPALKPYAEQLDACVNWNPDLRLGTPLSKVLQRVVRYDVGSEYADYGAGHVNRTIIRLVREHQPKYVIWPTMNYEIAEETFRQIRAMGSYVIGWFFDDECRFEEYSQWWIPYLDYFFTCDRGSLKLYQQLGAKALHIPVTADPEYFRPTPSPTSYGVSFIGSKRVADRGNLIERLRADGIEVAAFGKGWDSGYVTNDQMIRIYSNSRINICFTKSYGAGTRNQLKDKIFDITMCGGFLLCEYVPGVEEYFEIGKEIVCFSDYADAVEKVRYFLRNHAERKRIALAGHRRAVDQHAQQKILERAFRILETDTCSKTGRRAVTGSHRELPAAVSKLKERYHLNWAHALQQSGFPASRVDEEMEIALRYRIPHEGGGKAMVNALLVQLTYPSSPFPGPNLPVGLGYIAEQLEAHGLQYQVADLSMQSAAELFRSIAECSPEYVALSMMSLDVNHHYSLAAEIKRRFPRVKIVAGGAHISFVQKKALQECPAIDLGVVHEGEQTMVELLSGRPYPSIRGLLYRDADGSVVYTGQRQLEEELDRLSFPRYRKFKMERYGATLSVASSRGCPFSCTFCGAHLSMGRKWRARSVGSIVEEIEYWQKRGYNSFNFIDSNFFMSKERIMELCDRLSSKEIAINLTSDGMRANDADPVMLRKMKQFGLRSVAIGVESANDDILRSIKKGETLAELEKCLQTLRDLEISAVAFFIIGLPGETVEHVLNSFRFALRFENISTAYFFNPNPLPGTELHEYVKRHGMLRGNDAQILDNIGGMGDKILIETQDLPRPVREKLLQLAGQVSRLVDLRHRCYREGDGLSAKVRLEMEAEVARVNQEMDRLVPPSDTPHQKELRRTEEYEKIPTHLTREEKYKLRELAMSTPGGTFVEIGSYKGASSCFIAAGIRRCAGPATLYCVDTWQNDAMSEGKRDTYEEFLGNTEDFRDVIVPLRGRSDQIAREFDKAIDFLFIDGGHSFEEVREDVLAWFPKLKPGALVAFHDIGWAEGVQQVVKRFVQPVACNHGSLPNLYWANVRRTFLSVVIPTRNRAKLLYDTLESLTRQSYPEECFEVIVVDNGSTDATAEVCRHFSRRIAQFRRLYEPSPGLHNGRHAGLREARGEILVYADDDIEALPTWLEGVAESFGDPSVAMAGGKILPKFESAPPEWVGALSSRTDAGWSLGWYSLLDFGDTVHEIPHEYVWGCNFSIRKEVLLQAGGFHPDAFPQELVRYRGDGETALSYAVRDLGLKCLYNPKASVYHVVPSGRLTLEYVYQRAFNQGVSDSFASIRQTRSLSRPRIPDSSENQAHDAVCRGMADGFNYHQKLCAEDMVLQEWVLRNEYISQGVIPT